MEKFRKNKHIIALIFSGFILFSTALPLYSFSDFTTNNIQVEKNDSLKTNVENKKVIAPRPEEKKHEYKKPETSTKKFVYNIIFYLLSTFIRENPQILPR